MRKICLATSLALLFTMPGWARPGQILHNSGDVALEAETIREILVWRFGDLQEVISLLASLVPDLKVTILEDHPDQLLLEGSRAAIEAAKELLDTGTPTLDQIVLECKLADLSESQVQSFPVNWTTGLWEGRLCETVGPATGIAPSLPCNLEFGLFPRNAMGLQFLITQGEAHVLASPRIALGFGKEGEIHISDQFPLVQYNKQSGEFDTSYEAVGLELTCRCSLGPSGQISCHLKGKYSLLKELLAQEYPLIQTVFFERNAELTDGQSLIVGGLGTPDQFRAAAQKVPLLQDLPIQGTLFRNFRSRNKLYVMITPNLMN